jgi:hypothetical protein
MQGMATTRASKISTADLQYAEEVMEVYRLGDNSLATLGTRDIAPSFRRLYEWVQNPENYDTFIKTMVPKATDILSKHRQPEERAFIITPEKKGIGELEEFLRQHIAESQGKTQHEPAQRHPHTWTDRKRPATIDPSLLAGVQSPDIPSQPSCRSGDSDSSDQQSRGGDSD